MGKFCTRMVPALGFFYIACCLYLLCPEQGFPALGISLIVSSAFRTKAAAGGFIGSTLQSAARFGIARGLFTNEAGIGTAAIAAASSETRDPRRQSLISMTAVFWDTVVMCAVTGLVIVTNIQKNPASIRGFGSASLTSAAFTYLPFGGAPLLSLALVAFAITTLIGWCYYGERAVEYLFGETGIISYHLCYIVMIYIGAVLPMDLVWGFTDLINGIMVFPNVLALFALRKKIHI
ncbi:MAG: alanine:cation symporter family protein [Eisenbergiella massiliensis]